MENNHHSGLGHGLEYAFVNSARDLNRPVSWLVYHYVEIPLCPCHITCWDETQPLTATLGLTSFSICSWHLRDWHVPLSLRHLLQVLFSDCIKRFQTLNKTESPIGWHKRKDHDNIFLCLFGLGDYLLSLSFIALAFA